MRLALVHRVPGASVAPPDTVTWTTCLRDVHFFAGDPPAGTSDVLTDEDAYALLLEIVCGLRSPIIGETEVQAQFKAFAAAVEARGYAPLARLCQRVLADAKEIRRQHLQGLGAHSYGWYAARHLQGERLVVIGTGALAAGVVDALPPGVHVDIWGRREPAAPVLREPRVTFVRLGDLPPSGSLGSDCSFVVAAPVAEAVIREVAGYYDHLRKIIDLRASDHRGPLDTHVPVVSLADLFAEAEKRGDESARQVRDARAGILERSHAFAGREELHPFGWDDLCV